MPTLGPITAAYVSAVDSMLNTREIQNQVVDVQNEAGLLELNINLGNTMPVQQPVYYHFVNEPLFKLIDTTGATVTGSGTRTVTITGVTAATSGFNRANDQLLLPSTGNKTALIQSVTTTTGQDTIVIKGVDGGNITVTAGDKLASVSVAVGERSDTPLNKRYGFSKYSNKVQTFRETSQITDIENAMALEVTFNGQNKIIVKDQLEKAILFKGYINNAYFTGDMSDATYTDASPALVDNNAPTNGGGGGPVQTTRGIDKYITGQGGIVVAAATPGTVISADINTLLDAFTANRAPKEIFLAGASAARGTFDAYIQNLNSSGITSARLEMTNKNVDTIVESYRYRNYRLNFGNLPILDHPIITSQTIIAKCMYAWAMNGRVKVMGDSGATEMPNMQIRYFAKQTKYGTDMINEIQSGAFNPVNPTGTVAEWRVDWQTTQGLECLAPQWMARMRVLA